MLCLVGVDGVFSGISRELEMDFVIVDLSSLLLFVTVFTVN